MITIRPQDALRTETVTPGWHIVTVTNHFTKPSAGDGSTVHNFELEIVEGTFKGVPLKNFTLSEKAIGMGKNFFLACGMPLEEWNRAKSGEAVQFDEKNCVGKIVKAYVSNTKFENRTNNEAIDFLALDAAAV